VILGRKQLQKCSKVLRHRGVDESKPPKVSKRAALDINEKSELEDAEDLEKKYQSLYIIVVLIPMRLKT
jgi:hypothetical protein